MMWQHVPPFFLAWAIGCKYFDPDSNMRRPVKVFFQKGMNIAFLIKPWRWKSGDGGEFKSHHT
jgi:hypothetical protein